MNSSSSSSHPVDATPRLLILEDCAAVAAVISLLLEPSQWSVRITNNPREALKIIQNNEVDVFLTDYRLPHMDGLQVIEKIRLEGRAFPVILMTACPSEVDPVEIKRLGISGLLEKDFLVNELVPILRKVLGGTVSFQINEP